MTNVTLALRGIRGESAADIARRVLSITGSDKAALQALMLDDAELAQILTDAEAARDGAEADAVQTALDRIATAADRVQTTADRVQTGLDRVQTVADRVQTGLDRVATAADVVSSAANAAAVAGAVDTFARFSRADLYSLTDDTRRNLFMHSGIELLFASGYYRSGLAAPAAFLSLPGATYTRAGAATAETAAGAIINFAANVPRITDRGVLIEEARTNLLLRSAEFNDAAWTKAASGTGLTPVVTANDAAAPDGTMTADRVVLSLAGGTASGDRSTLQQGVTGLTATASYSNTYYVKGVAGEQIVYRQVNNNTYSGHTFTGGWDRIGNIETAATTISTIEIGLRGAQAAPASNAVTFHIWGGDLQLGAFRTSHIPTTGAAATRAADVMHVPVSGSAAFGVIAEGAYVGGNSAVQSSGRVLTQIGSSNSNRVLIFNGGGATRVFFQKAGVAAATIDMAGTVPVDTPFRAGFSSTTNDFRAAKDTVLGVSDAAGDHPNDATRLTVGTSHLGESWFNGYVRSIVYFPFTLNDNQLQVQSNLPSAPALSEALTTDATLDLMARASLYGVTDISQALGFSRTGVEAIFTTPYYRKGLLSSVSPNAVSLTFSRTGAGTALDVAGSIISFATGEMRRTDRGVLIEEARTNLLLNSATLSTQNVTVAAAAHTLSFYGTGTVTLTGVSTAGPLVGTGAGNRVTLTFTPTAGTLTLTVSGSVTSANLEAGATPSSYIPTGAATATRAADAVDAVVGFQPPAVFVQARVNNFTAGTRTFDLHNGTNNERISVTVNTAGTVSAFVTVGGSLNTIGSATSAVTAGTTFKAAVRRNAAGTWRLFVNGVAIGSESAVIAQPAATLLSVGRLRTNVEYLMGTVERFAAFPAIPTDAQLVALTTL